MLVDAENYTRGIQHLSTWTTGYVTNSDALLKQDRIVALVSCCRSDVSFAGTCDDETVILHQPCFVPTQTYQSSH